MKQFLKISRYTVLCFLILLVGVGVVHSAQAQDQPQPPQIVNVNFPCPDSGFSLGSCPPSANASIPDYINNLYKFAVGIAGLLALGMIVGGGVYYTVSAGSSDKQREAKDMITSAVWGVVLLLGSYLILNTINPQITSLSLSFGGAGKLTTTATLAGEGNQNASDCGDFPKISVYPAVSLKYGSSCNFRKNILGESLSLSNDSYYNDNVIFKTSVKSGSYVWTYPYFVKDNGTSSAKCLIYAYQELGSATGTTMIKLNEDLGLCAPRDQVNSATCSQWTFTAQESATAGGPKTFISVTVPVSGSFNYPDALKPPPTSASGGVPGINKSHCYTTYCTDMTWTCSGQ